MISVNTKRPFSTTVFLIASKAVAKENLKYD